MKNHFQIITIDGPSGAGKGVLAKKLAQAFNFSLLDSGAVYRTAALLAHQHALLDDTSSINEADIGRFVRSLCIKVAGNGRIIVNNKPFSGDIRSEFIGKLTSIMAAIPSVRKALLSVQQDIAKCTSLVADGRDMGTVVFKNANAKIYLTASAQTRARRRTIQLQQSNKDADFTQILAKIQARDARDQARSIRAQDALLIDSDNLSVDEVFHRSYAYCLSCHVRPNA